MSTLLRIAGITEESIVDGPGIRLVVFAQGCRHNCYGCHNPQTHPMDGGYVVAVDAILDMMKQNPLLDGITLSGGDPFEQAKGFRELASKAKAAGYHVVTYTGYTYEQLREKADYQPDWAGLLHKTDLLIDGPFIKDLHDPLLVFRGSQNQRVVDVESSLLAGVIRVIAV